MRLIESIRIEGGECQLLDYHQRRIDLSLEYLGSSVSLSLSSYIDELLSLYHIDCHKLYKLRLEYDIKGFYNGSISLYKPKRISSLALVEIDDTTCYEYKWLDRSALTSEQITECQEIIFTHQGLLTDTSYSNIVLEYPDGQMLSPRVPLLRGLMSKYLLSTNQIRLADLTIEDLFVCSRIHLINALLPLGRLSVCPAIIVR